MDAAWSSGNASRGPRCCAVSASRAGNVFLRIWRKRNWQFLDSERCLHWTWLGPSLQKSWSCPSTTRLFLTYTSCISAVRTAKATGKRLRNRSQISSVHDVLADSSDYSSLLDAGSLPRTCSIVPDGSSPLRTAKIHAALRRAPLEAMLQVQDIMCHLMLFQCRECRIRFPGLPSRFSAANARPARGHATLPQCRC